MFRRIAVVAAVLVSLSACSSFPTCSLGLGALHMSEPTRGAPLESSKDAQGRGREDVLDAVRAPFRCESADRRITIENTIMYNLRGENGGGIYGSPWIYMGTFDVKLKEWRR